MQQIIEMLRMFLLIEDSELAATYIDNWKNRAKHNIH